MAIARRITSIIQLHSLDDRFLTDCYVVSIGFSGLTAISEKSVAAGIQVHVDLTYVSGSGTLEGETIAARISACQPRSAGSHLIHIAFAHDLADDHTSRLAGFIRRELGLTALAPAPQDREAVAGTV